MKYLLAICMTIGFSLTASAQEELQFYEITFDEGNYHALFILEEDMTGYMYVRYVSADCNCYVTIREFMEVEFDEDIQEISLYGYEPVYANTLEVVPGYNADNFYIDQSVQPNVVTSVDDAGVTSNATLSFIDSSTDPGHERLVYLVDLFHLNDEEEQLSSEPEELGKIHLVLVLDTNDPTRVGDGAESVLSYFDRRFEHVAKHTGMEVVEHYHHANEFTRDRVVNTLNEMSVSSTDVVFFYYFGHGFRYDNESDPYPIMFIGENMEDSPETAGLELSAVYNHINQLQPRLGIVIAEACNKSIGDRAPYYDDNSTWAMNTYAGSKTNKFHDLFVKTKGMAIVASSAPGQKSWANSSGGYFFDHFMDAFNYEVSATNAGTANWNDIFEKVQVNTIRKSKEKCQGSANCYSLQEPHFKLAIDQ